MRAPPAAVVSPSLSRRAVLSSLALPLAAACERARARLVSEPWGVAGLGRPVALAVGDDALWVAATGVYEVGSGVFRVPWAGGLARAVALREPDVTAVALGARDVVWTTLHARELRAAPRDGGVSPRAVASHPRGFMASVAVVGDVVFASPLGGPLSAYPLAGGEGQAIHPAAALHLTATPDGALVFSALGAVWIARRGAAPLRLAEAPSLASLCVDDRHVYLADATTPRGGLTGALRRVPLAGGVAATLATGLHDPAAVAVGRGRVWYVGAHHTPSARSTFRVLGSVPAEGGLARYDEARFDVTALAVRGEHLYAAGVAGGRAGGVVRRSPA